ncbi:MAG: SDR family oxidoreductase [Dehalococcoidia bacterium]|nr:SDR family oxidoreductase [Dehalococcoidia bacterium]
MNSLEGKIAVITGGTSGIGEATLRLFVERGANVVFCGRSADSGERLASELGEHAVFVQADVSREEDIARAIEAATQRFGRLDILFNNAGASTPGSLETVTPDQFHYSMDLLLGSVLFGIKHAVPWMRAQKWGRIINNSSINGIRVSSGDYLYGTAKAAVAHVTKTAAIRLAPDGITVNAVSPGAVATPIFYGGSESARALDPDHEKAKFRKLVANLGNATPVGNAGMPIDVANAVAYLASDEARYINAHDLVVDGGMVARGTW